MCYLLRQIFLPYSSYLKISSLFLAALPYFNFQSSLSRPIDIYLGFRQQLYPVCHLQDHPGRMNINMMVVSSSEKGKSLQNVDLWQFILLPLTYSDLHLCKLTQNGLHCVKSFH